MGVRNVSISLGRGQADVLLSEESPASEASLRRAVDASGFTLRSIEMPEGG